MLNRMSGFVRFVVIIGLVVAMGSLGLGWWAARHHRRRARERGSEAARLDREVTRLRESLAANQAGPAPGQPQSREQKAIERQSALVAPEPFR